MLVRKISEQGLKKYLSTYKYKNAIGQDLWDAIGKASKMPVSSIVNSWLKQPGFPLIDITQKNNDLVIKQNRFLKEHDKEDSKGLWSCSNNLWFRKGNFKKT